MSHLQFLRIVSWIAILIFNSKCILFAESFPNTQAGNPPSPEEAVSLFTVPEGFNVSLFASEPDVQQPIAITTDHRGRLWVAENYTYAEVAQNFDTSLKDRVVILEDTDGDGRSDRRKVFWDAGRKLSSVEVGFGGVWVLCAPQMLFIPDKNQDDLPDGPPVVVLDGWNEGPVRHNIVNGLKWGPDGWLYGRHGIQATSVVGKPGAGDSQRVKLNCCIWRYHPVTEKFEVVCQGTTNSWGFDYDRHGEMFFINTVIGHLWHVLPGAHYRRMYGADFNPYCYGLIEQCADHFHWDTGEKWSDIRQGVTDTTSAAGGGHAHSGLMIYQGDNWPEKYRDTIFTLNFHGRRMNNERLVREHSGFVAKHAEDLFFANNEWFRGLDLISGPDGGVFVADWSDSGECHENDGVHRTSGRIYKVWYGQPEKKILFNLAELTDSELIDLQQHKNDWYSRQARRLLHERTAAGHDMSQAKGILLKRLQSQAGTVQSLRALWCLNLLGALDETALRSVLNDENEHIRVWAIRLLMDRDSLQPDSILALTNLAATENSGLVRLYLAAAMQRIPLDKRWELAQHLVDYPEDAQDRSQPLMIWYGIEPAVPTDTSHAVKLADQSQIPLIRQFIVRRLFSDLEQFASAVEQILKSAAATTDTDKQHDLLQGMHQALRGVRKAAMPQAWPAAAERFANSSSPEIQQLGRQIGVVFGDGQAAEALRTIVLDKQAGAESRQIALRSLIDERSDKTLALMKDMFHDRALVNDVIRGFAVYDAPDIADHLLGRYPSFYPTAKSLAIDTLTSRPIWAKKLLAAVDSGRVERSDISAYHARQMHLFEDQDLSNQLQNLWGTFRETTADKKQRIEQLRELLQTPGDASQGRLLFEKNCKNCHVLYGQGTLVGPDLTGANRHNLQYLLENIVDPSASVGKEFRASAIALTDGRILTGVVLQQSKQTLTIQTQQEKLTVNRDDVEQIKPQEVSLMPDGLLKQMTDQQIRNLFTYLQTKTQVSLP